MKAVWKACWRASGLGLAFLATAACTDLVPGVVEDDAPIMTAVQLSMEPPAIAPAAGEIFTVRIFITGAADVVSTPFRLQLDPDHLLYSPGGSAVGPFLGSAGSQVSFLTAADPADPSQVSVGISLLGSAGGGVTGSGHLCTLSFQVLGSSTASSTTVEPFNVSVFAPGLQRLPSEFPAAIIPLAPGP